MKASQKKKSRTSVRSSRVGKNGKKSGRTVRKTGKAVVPRTRRRHTSETSETGRSSRKVRKRPVDQVPEPLDSDWGLENPGPIPEKLLSAPGFIDAYTEHAMSTAIAPVKVLAFCGALALLSTLIGRLFKFGSSRGNIYTVALAPSCSGKEYPRKLNKRILEELGLPNMYIESVTSGEAIEEALIEEPCLLCLYDEFDTLLRQTKNDRDGRREPTTRIFESLSTSADSDYKTRKKANNDMPVTIHNPHLVLFGTAIPEHFYDALPERFVTNGFIGRLLIFEAYALENLNRRRPKDLLLPDTILKPGRHWADLQKQRRGSNDPKYCLPVPATDAAENVLDKILEEANLMRRKYSESGDDVILAVTSRIPEKAESLALLFALSENFLRPKIAARHINLAWQLVKHLARQTLFMAETRVASDWDERIRIKAAELIRKAGDTGYGHSELLRKLKIDKFVMERIISTLLERGEIEVLKRDSETKPAKVYRSIR